jgi:hypothetical protein
MATLADKRAWLRLNTSEEVPSRGRLRPDLEAMYDNAHPDDEPADDGWDSARDYEIADAAGRFEEWADNLDPEDLEPSVPMQPERPPRTARSARAARRAEPVGARTSRLVATVIGGKDKGKPGPKKKPAPRIGLEKFISRGYSTLGRMVKPLSGPMGNCLQAQAAFAGVVFEDMARGTVMDRLLQPAAKAEDKLDKGFALIAPPLIVLAIEQTQVAVNAGRLEPQQAMVRMAFLQPILRESLRIGLEVSESYAEQMKARIEQDARWDAEVDGLISMIFEMPAPEPAMAGAAA